MRYLLLAGFAAMTLVAPGLALAQGCSHGQAKMSCASGQTWDDATKRCVTVTG